MAKPKISTAQRKKTEESGDSDEPVMREPVKTDAPTESGKSRVKFESTLPRAEAVAYFEAIVAGLRKGAVKFKQGEESISLSPADHVDIEVKAQRKGSKESVSFEITWRTPDDSDLTISSN